MPIWIDRNNSFTNEAQINDARLGYEADGSKSDGVQDWNGSDVGKVHLGLGSDYLDARGYEPSNVDYDSLAARNFSGDGIYVLPDARDYNDPWYDEDGAVDGNDTIYGTSYSDFVHGSGGDDRVFGEGGRDKLDGGNGQDVIYGGDDDDRLDGENGHDRVYGGDGNDYIDGGSGHDTLSGDDGRDTLNGNSGNDNIFGDDGLGEGGGDVLNGQDGNDTIRGYEGDDTIDGGAGNDTIFDGEGDDIVKGGDGNDTFWLQSGGNDTITGGTGLDQFLFGSGGGHDVVTDFSIGDIVQFEPYEVEGDIAVDASFTIVDGLPVFELLVTLGDNASVTFENLEMFDYSFLVGQLIQQLDI